jgi:hypothetical protein
MADNKKQYEEAMKNLDSLLKKQKALNQSLEGMKTSWNAISTEVFKMGGAEWFKKVPKSAEDIQKSVDKISDMRKGLEDVGNEFDKALNQDKNLQSLQSNIKDTFKKWEVHITDNQLTGKKASDFRAQAQEDFIKQLRVDYKEMGAFSDAELKNLVKQFNTTDDIAMAVSKLPSAHKKVINSLAEEKDLLNQSVDKADEMIQKIREEQSELKKLDKDVFSISAGLSKFSTILMKEGLGALKVSDQELSTVQRNTGIAMKDNAAAFGDLTGRVSQFGMSVKDAGEMMAGMSDELNTTNFSVLSKATEDFASIAGATGAASKEITTISGELMRMGKSSGEVKDYFEGADKMARSFGISSKKAIDGISRNLTKMRTMGFVGGEKSLAKMVVTAEKLNMNVDEIFDVAKKARNIEGAMEMASELQLAGGSFANINPMDLLAAARKGPAELQKILTTMGKDVGRFNKETGEYEFDPVDIERLQIVADATGQSLDSITKGIQKSGLDKEKIEPFAGMMDGLDEADKALAQSSLGDMMKFNEKNGKFEIDADNDLAKKMGITSLDQIGEKEIKAMLEKKKNDEKTLEEQNKRNQSFEESLKNFWGALESIFTVFEPVLNILTGALQGITKVVGKLPGWGKWIVGSLVVAFALFGTSVGAFITQGIGKFASSIKDFGSGIMKFIKSPIATMKGAFTKKTSPTDTGTDGAPAGPKAGVGEGFKSLAEGLGAMGTTPGVLKGILAVALSGPAFLLFVPALPGLMVMALIGTVADPIKKGFTAIAEGLAAFGNTGGIFKGIGALALAAIPLAIFGPLSLLLLPLALIGVLAPLIEAGFKAIATGIGFMGSNLGNIIKGSLAILIVGAAMIPFVLAATYMSDIDWMSVLKGVGVMALVLVGLIGVGIMASTVGWLILLGAGLLAAAGLAMMVAAAGLSSMGEAFAMLSEIDGSSLSSLAGVMFLLGPGLLAFSFAMLALSFVNFDSLKQLGTSLEQLGTVNVGNLAALGSALGSMAPGLMSFGLSAMLFANPIALFGIWAMTSALSGLVAVMTPLASALTLGSTSLNSFASGLDRLATAANALSDDKLERLQKISEAMASASASGNVANVMTAVAGGAGGGSAEPRKIEIDIKLNGRDVQYQIVKDTAVHK